MFKQVMRKRKEAKRREFNDWFSSLDDDSKQETAINYLRSLDTTSYKKCLNAVDKYREGDKILKGVKDPEADKTDGTELPKGENPDFIET